MTADHQPTPSELMLIAERLARHAGSTALAGRRAHQDLHSDTTSVATKATATDVVTIYDQAAEALIVDWLRTNRPNDGIVGEEGSSHPSTTGLEWHIDPIDGTTNFVYDQPAWACSIGVRGATGTLAGAVYIPALDEMFCAAARKGATLNGHQIHVSQSDDLSLSLIATGFSSHAARRSEEGAIVAKLIEHVRDIRRLGSAAIDLCFVACGRVDAYYEPEINSWDVLAGELIAAEAGAVVSSLGGGAPQPGETLAATPGIHAALVELLGSLDPHLDPHSER